MFWLLLILMYRLDDKEQKLLNLSQVHTVNTIAFNCFIHSNEHLSLYTWKTNLSKKYRLLEVIPRGWSPRPHRLLCWGEGRAMARETCPFVPHIWSLFTAGLLPTSMQPQKGLAASSLTLCAPPVLQSCSATFPQCRSLQQLFPPHPSCSPLTNQGAFWLGERFVLCTHMCVAILGDAGDRTGSSFWHMHLFLRVSSKRHHLCLGVPRENNRNSIISWSGKDTSFHLIEIKQNRHTHTHTHFCVCVTVLMSTYRQECVLLLGHVRSAKLVGQMYFLLAWAGCCY